MSFRCSTCGEVHDGLPDVGVDRPDYYWGVPEQERDDRIELTTDTCVIDNEHYFIRGLIEIPIVGHSQNFCFGVWVSQKRENFRTYLDNSDSSEIGPFFGWLSTDIAYYPKDTLSLKTLAHFRGGGNRPSIELETIDQRNGITLEKAWDIVHFFSDKTEEPRSFSRS